MEQEKFELSLHHYSVGLMLANGCMNQIKTGDSFDGSYLVTAAFIMLQFTKRLMMEKGDSEEDVKKIFKDIENEIQLYTMKVKLQD